MFSSLHQQYGTTALAHDHTCVCTKASAIRRGLSTTGYCLTTLDQARQSAMRPCPASWLRRSPQALSPRHLSRGADRRYPFSLSLLAEGPSLRQTLASGQNHCRPMRWLALLSVLRMRIATTLRPKWPTLVALSMACPNVEGTSEYVAFLSAWVM